MVEVGDIPRFPNRDHFASWNGTAPIDASSGDHVRHRLSRAGNRQINRVLHTMARVQLRNPTEGRAYYDRKKADGKAPMEAMRCVKRLLSDIVFQTMLNDAVHTTDATTRTGSGGQRGNDSDSSAAGSHPHTGSSDKSVPGPARQNLEPLSLLRLDTEGCQIRTLSVLLHLSAAAPTETIRVVIIRVARFADASVIGRDWITDALRGVPGIRAAYHAAIPGQTGYISVAIADNERALEAGTQAIAQRRAELEIAGLGPDEVSVYVVDHFVENFSGEKRP